MSTIKRVMVICTGNICRSPMAAAILQEELRSNDIEVTSAGLGALGGHEADALAVMLMEERGLDVNGHRAVQFDGQRGLACDLILVMETAQRRAIEQNWTLLQGRVYRLGHWGKFDVDDPYQRGEQAFRKSLTTIDRGVGQWLEVITA